MKDCIEHGQKNARGYGSSTYNGKFISLHRKVYLINKGPTPEGLVVMHICDNPRCINPEHLKLGTQLENMADKFNKGRHVSRGPSVSDEVLEDILNSKETQTQLAQRYGLHQSTISKMKSRYKNKGGSY